MSEKKWTPGPWRVEQDTTQVWGNCNADDLSDRGMGYPITLCRITPSGSWTKRPDDDEGEANANLIAAAPDLYDALEMVRDADEDCKRDGLPTIPTIARAKIDAALSRARGQQ